MHNNLTIFFSNEAFRYLYFLYHNPYMIHKTLNFAQVLGDHLAQGKLPPRDLLAGPARTSDYIYLQLKPLKDIEHAIALWQ